MFPWNITRTHEIAVEIGKALSLNSFNTKKKKKIDVGLGGRGAFFQKTDELSYDDTYLVGKETFKLPDW